MKTRIAALLLCLGGCSFAQSVWLTVSGNPEDPSVNTIEVDPVPVDVREELRIMKIRVNRSAQRTSWDGTPYRSYTARVQINCMDNSARYQSITFHALPVWKGEPLKTTDYTVGPPRWMEFRDVSPNPNLRIIRAACIAISRGS
jgi:hypothetical protein